MKTFATSPIFENEHATAYEEVSLKPLSARDLQNLPKTTNTRRTNNQVLIRNDNKKLNEGRDQDEVHHYMSLLPGLRSAKKKRGGSSGTCADNTSETHKENDTHPQHKDNYMSLIPALRITSKPNAGSNSAIYMGLVPKGASNEILPKPKDAEKWEIPTANLFVGEKLAAGKFVVTSKGTVCSLNGCEGERVVVIKTIQGMVLISDSESR